MKEGRGHESFVWVTDARNVAAPLSPHKPTSLRLSAVVNSCRSVDQVSSIITITSNIVKRSPSSALIQTVAVTRWIPYGRWILFTNKERPSRGSSKVTDASMPASRTDFDGDGKGHSDNADSGQQPLLFHLITRRLFEHPLAQVPHPAS